MLIVHVCSSVISTTFCEMSKHTDKDKIKFTLLFHVTIISNSEPKTVLTYITAVDKMKPCKLSNKSLAKFDNYKLQTYNIDMIDGFICKQKDFKL